MYPPKFKKFAITMDEYDRLLNKSKKWDEHEYGYEERHYCGFGAACSPDSISIRSHCRDSEGRESGGLWRIGGNAAGTDAAQYKSQVGLVQDRTFGEQEDG